MDGKLRNMTSVYISRGDKMLMLYRVGSKVGADSWRGFGGHFEENELNDARACVLRELYEEIGISESDLDGLRLRYIALRQINGEIRQNYYFFADLKPDVNVDLVCNEGTPKWVDYNELSNLDMPFSAKYVLEHYLSTGKNDDKVYGGIAVQDGVVFTEMNNF